MQTRWGSLAGFKGPILLREGSGKKRRDEWKRKGSEGEGRKERKRKEEEGEGRGEEKRGGKERGEKSTVCYNSSLINCKYNSKLSLKQSYRESPREKIVTLYTVHISVNTKYQCFRMCIHVIHC